MPERSVRRRVLAALVAVILVTGGCATIPRGGAGTGDGRGPPPGPPEPAVPEPITLLAAGDLLVHDSLIAQARAEGGGTPDFGPTLADVAPWVRAADLAICHLETPLAPDGGPYSGYPSFSTPPQLATAIAETGWDGCSTASNHSLDAGLTGIGRTLDTLDAARLRHAGTARSAAEAAAITTYDVRGVRVAHLAATYGFNGLEPPDYAPWSARRLSAGTVDDLVDDAARARAAGADVVVLSAHWGDEYETAPNALQRDLGPALLASEIDLVIGHHAHVVQPFERVDGEWVAWGLGNHLADQATRVDGVRRGAMARFTLAPDPAGRWGVLDAEYVPTVIDDDPVRVRVADGAPDPVGDTVRARGAPVTRATTPIP